VVKKVSPKSLTRPFQQQEVAVYAVYLLGGAAHSIDTEDVAVRCHEIAPRLFSWKKYKEQINLEIVRVNLSNAKKAQNGRLLTGSGRAGWRLTNRGLDWVRAREKAGYFRSSMDRPQISSKAGSIDSVRRERERKRLIGSKAWNEWKATDQVSVHGAQQVYRVNEYTTQQMMVIKVARLRSMFDDEDELSRFLRIASESLLKERSNQ
jgi:hypothetical protein